MAGREVESGFSENIAAPEFEELYGSIKDESLRSTLVGYHREVVVPLVDTITHVGAAEAAVSYAYDALSISGRLPVGLPLFDAERKSKFGNRLRAAVDSNSILTKVQANIDGRLQKAIDPSDLPAYEALAWSMLLTLSEYGDEEPRINWQELYNKLKEAAGEHELYERINIPSKYRERIERVKRQKERENTPPIERKNVIPNFSEEKVNELYGSWSVEHNDRFLSIELSNHPERIQLLKEKDFLEGLSFMIFVKRDFVPLEKSDDLDEYDRNLLQAFIELNDLMFAYQDQAYRHKGQEVLNFAVLYRGIEYSARSRGCTSKKKE